MPNLHFRTRDFYHTCYGLSGLSVSQHCLDGKIVNITEDKSDILVRSHTYGYICLLFCTKLGYCWAKSENSLEKLGRFIKSSLLAWKAVDIGLSTLNQDSNQFCWLQVATSPHSYCSALVRSVLQSAMVLLLEMSRYVEHSVQPREACSLLIWSTRMSMPLHQEMLILTPILLCLIRWLNGLKLRLHTLFLVSSCEHCIWAM